MSRAIYLWGPIDNKISYRVIRRLRFLATKNLEPILLFINSEGGSADDAYSIIDEIDLLKEFMEIWTIVQGVAFSCAADILTMGTKDKRFATQNSSIMFHQSSYSLEYDYLPQQAKAVKFVHYKENTIIDIVAGACQKMAKTFRKDIANGLWLNAEQAISYGAIDKIWTSENIREVLQE